MSQSANCNLLCATSYSRRPLYAIKIPEKVGSGRVLNGSFRLVERMIIFFVNLPMPPFFPSGGGIFTAYNKDYTVTFSEKGRGN